MTYFELINKLTSIEKATGLHLVDTCVDQENAGLNASDSDLFNAAVSAAGQRAEDQGKDINVLFGSIIY